MQSICFHFFSSVGFYLLYIMLAQKNLYPIDNEQVLIYPMLLMMGVKLCINCFSSPDVCIANQIMTSDWLKGVVVATPESKSTTPVKGSTSGRSKVARRRVSFVKYVEHKKHYHMPAIGIVCIPFYTSSYNKIFLTCTNLGCRLHARQPPTLL